MIKRFFLILTLPSIISLSCSKTRAENTESKLTSQNSLSSEKSILLDSKIFDYSFYINKYSDLKVRNFTEKEAQDHWVMNGIREERQASPSFDIKFYKANNPDVVSAFQGLSHPNLKIAEHFLMHGIKEGRVSVNTPPIGMVDSVANGKIRGWAIDPDEPQKPLVFKVFVGGRLVHEGTARESRPDLVSSGTASNPEHGFNWDFDSKSNQKVIVKVVDLQDSAQITQLKGQLFTDATSKGFIAPSHKQGLDDHAAMDWARATSSKVYEDRLAETKQHITPGIRRYNVFWGTFENGPISAKAPISCPQGFMLFPENESARLEGGFHSYHCYNIVSVQRFDTFFESDRRIGAHSTAVIYDTPEVYRHPQCTGFDFGTLKAYKSGCFPIPERMDDYEDFIGFLSQRYSGKENSKGTLSHYIVWNEVASQGWTDLSPFIPNRVGQTFTSEHLNHLVDRYADMMVRTDRAVRRFQRGVMIYVSVDHIWKRPQTPPDGVTSHVGTLDFLEVF